MNLYTATINIGKAPVKHEIVRGPENTLTPAEILLLRAIHGDDSVYKVEFAGERAVDQKRERTRLDVKYGVSEANKKTIERLFGPALAPHPLPMAIDIDALRIVSEGVNALRSPERAMLLIPHYQRLLEYIVPDKVHVLANGRIQRTGGKELALELERSGYADFTSKAA